MTIPGSPPSLLRINQKKLPRLRQILIVEGRGVRTAIATVFPFVLGQCLGYAAVGLMIGLGGLYVCIADKNGAGGRTLAATVLGTTIAAYLGTLVGPHPVVAALSMFVGSFALALTGVWGEAAGNAGFAVTLVFAVTMGLAPLRHENDAAMRAAEFAIGGAWATLLTITFRRFLRQSLPPTDAKPLALARRLRDLRSILTLKSRVLQHALRFAVAATLAVIVYKVLRLEHGYWLIITVLVIVKQDWAATRQRAWERMSGSIIGGALGVLLAATVHNIVAIDLLLLLLCMIAFSHSPTNYGLYVVFLTPFVVLMINIAAPGNWKIALTRIEDNLIGGVLALTVAYLLRARGAAAPAAT